MNAKLGLEILIAMRYNDGGGAESGQCWLFEEELSAKKGRQVSTGITRERLVSPAQATANIVGQHFCHVIVSLAHVARDLLPVGCCIVTPAPSKPQSFSAGQGSQ